MPHPAADSRSILGPDAGQLRLVLESTDRVERLIVQKYGVQSSALHAQVDELLKPSPTYYYDDDEDGAYEPAPELTPFMKKLRFLATVRNRLMHEPDYDRIDDLKAYKAAVASVTSQLKQMADYRNYDEGESGEELLSRRGNPLKVSEEYAQEMARVLGHTRPLEQLLESKFGAKGQGLDMKAQSCAARMPATITLRLRRCAAIRNAAIHFRDLSKVKELARLAAQLESELLAQSPEQFRQRVEEEAAAARRRQESLRATIGELLAELTTESSSYQRWWYPVGSLLWGFCALPVASFFGVAPNELPGFAATIILGTLLAATLPALLAGLFVKYLVFPVLGRDAPAANSIFVGLSDLLPGVYLLPIVFLLLGVVWSVVGCFGGP